VHCTYVERARRLRNCFRGRTDATATFDIGNPNLKTEVAKSSRSACAAPKDHIRFEATGYYTKFDGFIFRRLTGNTCDGATSCVTQETRRTFGVEPSHLLQRDATFARRIPISVGHAGDVERVRGVDGQYDIVRANFTDGTNVPRIPTQRVGAASTSATPMARPRQPAACFAQNDIAIIAKHRQGLRLLKVEISHTGS